VRAVVYAGPGRVEVDDVAEPRVQEASDAVVKVRVAAICGSDLHLLNGKTPGMREGGIIGHEFVGEVVEAGADARRHPEGTRVLGSFLIACGECDACRAARYNFCSSRRALGLGTLTGDLDGAQAEYVRVPNADLNLKALDGAFAGLSDEQALFGGDILASAYYCVALAGPECEVAVVVGGGPVGLLCAAALRAKTRTVLVLDTDPQRVTFARERLGLAAYIADGRTPESPVRRHADGRLADVAVDAVGAIPALKTAMRCARDGGRVVVLGVYGAERYDLPLGMSWIRGLDLRFAGMANVQANWDAALRSVANKTIDPTKLITHRLPLDDAPEGYALFESREALKVLLVP
jgi:2-desacetyl-2-hydroxyethyl bacteriochlorophyllide A dehydrogenase